MNALTARCQVCDDRYAHVPALAEFTTQVSEYDLYLAAWPRTGTFPGDDDPWLRRLRRFAEGGGWWVRGLEHRHTVKQVFRARHDFEFTEAVAAHRDGQRRIDSKSGKVPQPLLFANDVIEFRCRKCGRTTRPKVRDLRTRLTVAQRAGSSAVRV
jgi:hypothetical protein